MPKGKPTRRVKWHTITDKRDVERDAPKEKPKRKDGMTLWPKPKKDEK